MNGYCPHLGLSPPHWEILDPSLINGNIVYNYQKIAVQFLILLKTYSKFSSGRREHFSCVNNGRYSHIFRFMENLLFPFVGNLHKSLQLSLTQNPPQILQLTSTQNPPQLTSTQNPPQILQPSPTQNPPQILQLPSSVKSPHSLQIPEQQKSLKVFRLPVTAKSPKILQLSAMQESPQIPQLPPPLGFPQIYQLPTTQKCPRILIQLMTTLMPPHNLPLGKIQKVSMLATPKQPRISLQQTLWRFPLIISVWIIGRFPRMI